MLLDLTEAHQEYVEDCEVCCNPIAVELTADQGALTQFEANQMD